MKSTYGLRRMKRVGKTSENLIYQMYYQHHRLTFKLGSYHALLRTFVIGHAVEQMYGTTMLKDQTYLRLKRTRDLIYQLIYHGLDSEPGRDVINHLIDVHQGLNIDNDSFRYVLSCFFLEPLRWNRVYSRHPLPYEQQAKLVEFWSEVGVRMGVKNVSLSLPQWEAFQVQYELRYQQTNPFSQELAKKAVEEVVKISIPFGLRSLARQLILSTLDPSVKACLNLPSAYLLVEGITDRFCRNKPTTTF